MRAALLVMTMLVSAVGPADSALAAGAGPGHQEEIVGGVTAAPGEFPWMVRLSNGCAGTLVRETVVLTAAHCVRRTGRNTSLIVTAGSTDLESASTQDIRSTQTKRARGFTDVTQGNDWALIRLQRAVKLPLVTLPTGPQDDNGVFTVIGWGSTSEGSMAQENILRKVQVPFVGDGECQRLYGADGYGIVEPDMICAGDTQKGGRDSCQGDSGGPLLKRAGNTWVQVGIVSWGVGCARAAFPGVYTQVSRFIRDIQAALSIEDFSSSR